MNRFLKSAILALSIVFTLQLLHSCKPGRTANDMIVTASILPLKYFVDHLSGEAIEVNIMVPPGASHSSYSPTSQQFKKLSDSRLYLRIGHLGYEQAWIGRLREINPVMDVVNLSDYVELIKGEVVDHGDHKHESGIDPHIWMSPATILDVLPIIKEAVIRAFPELREEVEANYPALLADIESLHQDFLNLSAALTQKSFMIYHPALTYLARDYGLNQVSVEHEGKEPSPAMLGRIIRDARTYDIPVIFIQEEYDMRSADLISKETGASLVQINPLSYDYPEALQHILSSLSEHLQ